MGMYTELIFGASIKKDAPKKVINTLHYLVNHKKLWEEVEIEESVTNGRNVLDGGGSYYFGVNTSVAKMWQDDIDQEWKVSSRCNIKNYEREIETFLAWVKPFIDSGSGEREMYAITIYEEQAEPTIYYLYDAGEY
jgi:hypothetical protein